MIEDRQSANGRSPGSPVVLLVEDEPLLAIMTQAALEEGGYDVVVATGGKKAMEWLNAGLRFWALVTDIRLGNGPNGWQLAQHARRSHPELPVVYVSGDAGEDCAERAVCGSVILQKPINTSQLLAAVSNVDGPYSATGT
jgi:DNA-binding NtrC family response regulator